MSANTFLVVASILAGAAATSTITAIVVYQDLQSWKQDVVTRLLVRRAFYERARRALRRRPDQTLVLYVDLDRFKQVNDTYGHDAGDWVLRVIASRLRRHLGAQATVGHLGGDEFAAVSDVGPAHGPWLAATRELVGLLTTPITLSRANQPTVSVTVGVSIGAVHLHGVRHPVLSGVLKLAEQHCRHAKFEQGGGLSFVIAPDPTLVARPAKAQPLVRLRDTRTTSTADTGKRPPP